MWDALKSAWALLLGIGLMMVGNGLQGTLLAVRATSEDFGEATTGIIMSGYYVGFFIGSVLVPKYVSSVGHIRVFAALATIASSSVLLHSVFVEPSVWMAMRVITGFSYAGLYIVAESWLNGVSTNSNRGSLLSVYMVVSQGAIAAGQFMLVLSDPDGFILFILVSVVVSLSLVPLALTTTRGPSFDKPTKISLMEVYRASPTGVIGSFLNGLGFGAIFTMGAVYARSIGFSLGEVSIFMAVTFFAPVFTLWPIGVLSDRFDRRIVIVTIALIASALAAVIGLKTDAAPFLLLVVVMGLHTGFQTPIYSLCIAYTNDYLDYEQMVAASSKLVLINGMGAVMGPVSVAAMMGWFGPAAFGWSIAVVYAVLGLFVLYRMSVRGALPADEQTNYVPMSPRGTMVAAAMSAEEMEESSDSPQDSAEQDQQEADTARP
jgi:MFS family permease